jgi:amino acid transporter
VFIIAMLGVIVACIVLALTNHETFVSIFNAYSAKYGSPDYQTIIEIFRENTGITVSSFSLSNTLKLMPIVFWSFGYFYVSSMVGGEVKDAKRNFIVGNLTALVISTVFTTLALWLYQERLGSEFLTALIYVWACGLGYNLPFPPYFFGIVSLLTENIVIKILLLLSFICWNFAYTGICYIVLTRPTFAWAFDRLIPSWFASLSGRYRTPVKNIIFFSICGWVALIMYALYMEVLGSFSVVILNILTTFMLTAISALILPYRKKLKQVYDASPVSRWKIGGIPLISICAIGNIIWLLANLYYFLITPELGAYHIPSLILSAVVFIFGLIWYYAARAYNKRRLGIDIAKAYEEIPPV